MTVRGGPVIQAPPVQAGRVVEDLALQASQAPREVAAEATSHIKLQCTTPHPRAARIIHLPRRIMPLLQGRATAAYRRQYPQARRRTILKSTMDINTIRRRCTKLRRMVLMGCASDFRLCEQIQHSNLSPIPLPAIIHTSRKSQLLLRITHCHGIFSRLSLTPAPITMLAVGDSRGFLAVVDTILRHQLYEVVSS